MYDINIPYYHIKEVERTSMISSEDKEFQEDAKIAPKEDNSKGNQMHESTQGSLKYVCTKCM